jgi:hypothetical protein
MTAMTYPLDDFLTDYAGQSVSHGTMRDEDLIDTFSDVLFQLARPKAEDLRENFAGVYGLLAAVHEGLAEATDKGTESLGDLTRALFDALDDVAPEGFYFGAIEGDGSDYGFWATEGDE